MKGDDDMHFANPKLARFYQQFKDHMENFERHVEDEAEFTRRLTEACESNAESSKQNTESIQKIEDNTKALPELLDAWNATQGVVKAGSALVKFIKWLTVLGVSATLLWNWLVNQTPGS